MESIKYLETIRLITNMGETLTKARIKAKSFIRKRMMSFSSAIEFMLDMRKTTLQTRLNIYFEQTGKGTSMSQQAFSKLRMNFDHSPFETMVRETVKEEYKNPAELPLWHGYHVFGIDGSYFQLPRSKELYDTFGIHGRPPQCPNAGISIMFDVLSGWAVDPIITDAKMNERAECAKHIDFLCSEMPNIAKNSIFLMDRGYPSLDMFKKIQTSGLKFVIRARTNHLPEIDNAPMGDSTFIRDGIEIRVIKLTLPNGDVEILLTNLFELSQSLVIKLYTMRWVAETAYFKLKRELCVEKFSGRTANSVYQDFWASMVLLNAVAVFQAEADAAVALRQEGKGNKHFYNARTSDLIITLRDRFIFATLCGNPDFSSSEFELIINTMARSVSAVRPNRSFLRIHRPFSKTCANLKSFL